ncbi:DMT family transporter [Pedobacter xixiisoli]|uniref:Permease of the drug/metabolite transporter (DMT) superfamily n=1 Tax=Pedobacter xixiisoli TaxID=1476464 RepID=A0A286AAQ6_9SPHI|nr:EamA family transporter [Pedobacter xixiisoli]SOD18996.1 Permease of the drug/metabolite transporter (DMT) superfamily [Pedobacter xixiisoli]
MLEPSPVKEEVLLLDGETPIVIASEINGNPRMSKQMKGFVLAIIGATLWGVSGTFGQFLFQQRGVNVEWLITVRMLISGSLLLLFSSARDFKNTVSILNNRRDFIQLIIFGITGMVAVQYTYFAAIKHSNAATATILQFAGPVLISLYLALKNRRWPRSLEVLSIGLAVFGTFLLVTHGDVGTLSISKTAFMMGIASAVALAIYTLQPVNLLKRYDSGVIVGWGMLIGGIAFSFIKAPWQVEGVWDSYSFISAAFIIIFGTLIAFYTYLTSVKLIGGQKSSLLASAEPLSAALLSVIWLKVPFHTMDWIGGLCIISTVFILSRTEKS